MPRKETLIVPPKTIATPDGDKVIQEKQKTETSSIPAEKFWNSHSLFVAGMGAGMFSAVLAAFGMAESMQEKGHIVKIEFVFDKKFLHGMIHHITQNGRKNTYGFDSIEELLKLMELLSSQYAIIDEQRTQESNA